VTRYAGLDATVFHSGEEHYHGHISRQGSSLLRKYAVEAALAALRSNQSAFAALYQRLKPSIGHARAVVATARKLLIVAWTLMKAVRPALEVDPRKYRAKLKKLERGGALYPTEERWALLRVSSPGAVNPAA
jgi:transposase